MGRVDGFQLPGSFVVAVIGATGGAFLSTGGNQRLTPLLNRGRRSGPFSINQRLRRGPSVS